MTLRRQRCGRDAVGLDFPCRVAGDDVESLIDQSAGARLPLRDVFGGGDARTEGLLVGRLGQDAVHGGKLAADGGDKSVVVLDVVSARIGGRIVGGKVLQGAGELA